jgi:hypothetical protein
MRTDIVILGDNINHLPGIDMPSAIASFLPQYSFGIGSMRQPKPKNLNIILASNKFSATISIE